MLPPGLLEHAGIGELAAFVGQGPRFQIWEPKAREAFAAEARERARRQGMTLRVKPPQGVGGAGSPVPGGEPDSEPGEGK